MQTNLYLNILMMQLQTLKLGKSEAYLKLNKTLNFLIYLRACLENKNFYL